MCSIIDCNKPISTHVYRDGRIERRYSDGRTEETFPNGTIKLTVLIDGCRPYSTVIMPLTQGD